MEKANINGKLQNGRMEEGKPNIVLFAIIRTGASTRKIDLNLQLSPKNLVNVNVSLNLITRLIFEGES